MSLFNQYDRNLKNRIKANSIILSFDEDANKTFNQFINLSNNRFKAVKYGGKLNNILSKQKPKYINMNTDILNDIIYNTEYLTKEKNKFYKSVNHFCVKKINKLREKLIN